MHSNMLIILLLCIKGNVYKQGTPVKYFIPEELIKLGLDVPESIRFQLKFEKIRNQI